MSTAIREEVLVHFFKSYLQLVCRGSARSIVNNPALDFTKKAKSGGFDHLDDDDYTQLLAETEELSSLWHQTSSQPAFAVLVEALTRMNPDGEQLDTCARILASAYASSEQFASASNTDDMPSLLSLSSKIWILPVPSAIFSLPGVRAGSLQTSSAPATWSRWSRHKFWRFCCPDWNWFPSTIT